MRFKRLAALMLALVVCIGLVPPGNSLMVLAATDTGGERVAQFVADNHVLMLRADGRLLGWGDNRYGQLGLGEDAATKLNSPAEITFFSNKAPIKQLAVIQDSSFVLLTNGDLYATGKGDNGRLGLNDTNPRSEWTLVNPDTPFNRLHINESAEFAVAESFDGHIYTWGKNDKGQCGNNTTTNVFKPTKVRDSANVDTLWVGTDYVLYTDLSGNLVGWGNLSSPAAGMQGHYQRVVKARTINCGGVTNKSDILTYPIAAMPNSPIPTTLLHTLYPRPQSETAPSYTIPAHKDTVLLTLGDGYYTATVNNHSNTSCSGSHRVEDGGGSSTSKSCSVLKLQVISHDATPINQSWTIYNSYQSKSTQMLELHKSIDTIMTGSSHAVAYSDGKYYGWGDTSKKQLGSLAATPEPVELIFVNSLITSRKLSDNVDLLGLDVVRNTTYLRWSDGKIHAYGDNAYNKAGVEGAPITIAAPMEITTLQGKDVINVVSGRDTTYYIDSNGSIYVSGSNLLGQAGLGADYDNSATIATPTENPNVKFSYTAEPPTPPKEVKVPVEAVAGNTVTVEWDEVPEAVSYELTRTVAYANGEVVQETTTEGDTEGVGSAASSSQVIYNGADTQYVDSISPDWESIAYSVRSLNYVGDYSAPIITGNINIKIPSTPANDTTPPTVNIIPDATKARVTIVAEDSGSGMEGIYIDGQRVATNVHTYTLTVGETISITAKDKAGNVSSTRIISYSDIVAGGGGKDTDPGGNNGGNNNGGGMTNEQLLALLAAMGGNKGLSASELAALLSSNKGMTAAELAALLSGSNSNNNGLSASDIARLFGSFDATTGSTDTINPALLAMLAQQPNNSTGSGSGNEQLMAAMLQIVSNQQQGNRDINFNITLPGELAAALQQQPNNTPMLILSFGILLLLLIIGLFLAIPTITKYLPATAAGGRTAAHGDDSHQHYRAITQQAPPPQPAYSPPPTNNEDDFWDSYRPSPSKRTRPDVSNNFGAGAAGANTSSGMPDIDWTWPTYDTQPPEDNAAVQQAPPDTPLAAPVEPPPCIEDNTPAVEQAPPEVAQAAPAEQQPPQAAAEQPREDSPPAKKPRQSRRKKAAVQDVDSLAAAPALAEPDFSFSAADLVSDADFQNFVVED